MIKNFNGNIEEFQRVLQNEPNNQQVIVDFWAAWCAPCRMLTPILEQIETENSNITLIKIDVDNNTELSRVFNISSIPTLMFFQNGVMNKSTLIGALPKEAILEHIKLN